MALYRSLLLLAAAAAPAVSQNTSEASSEVPYYGQSPPVYPCPVGNGTTSSAWARAYKRAKALTAQMTVEEKVNMTRGFDGMCVGNSGAVPRLNIPSLCFSDAPDGVRGAEFASAFPAGIHIASTWDKAYMYQYGRALGEEYHDMGIHVALAPVAGPLGRMARGGRNWEGLSADPYLAGAGMGEITRGIQDAGVIATPKHWLAYEQEYRRMPGDLGESISSHVDDRTLHELYVFPFMDSLREGAGSIMCSYNRVNQSYACQNSKLMNGILKTELGFEGFVVSDWDGQHTGIASANAGLDIVMPDGGYWGDNLTQAVNNGSVSTDRIDDMATRILSSWYFTGQDNGFPSSAVYSNTDKHEPVNVQRDHATLIREVGTAGIIMVKNVNNTLPLQRPTFLSIYGRDATIADAPWENHARYGGDYSHNFGWETFNGTLITGGGSGSNTPPYVVSPFEAIQARIRQDKGMVRWDFTNEDPTTPYVNSDACLVFINAYASESFDRTSLTDVGSDNLVKNVAANCSNTIVVLHSAGIRVVDEWIDNENVTAVLFAGLPGQESGNSLVPVLWGDISPSGRMPYTVAKNESDYNVLNSTVSDDYFPESNFTEGLYIDYRAFDRNGIEPRFEFGFGLTYTTFEYSALEVDLAVSADVSALVDSTIPIVQGGHPQLWDVVATVTALVSNTGSRTAEEVAQLYVGIPSDDGYETPERQLRGFEKVPVRPGETRTVTFGLTRRDLSVWDVVTQQWRLQAGSYNIWVGASSRDLRLNGTLQIEQ